MNNILRWFKRVFTSLSIEPLIRSSFMSSIVETRQQQVSLILNLDHTFLLYG